MGLWVSLKTNMFEVNNRGNFGHQVPPTMYFVLQIQSKRIDSVANDSTDSFCYLNVIYLALSGMKKKEERFCFVTSRSDHPN